MLKPTWPWVRRRALEQAHQALAMMRDTGEDAADALARLAGRVARLENQLAISRRANKALMQEQDESRRNLRQARKAERRAKAALAETNRKLNKGRRDKLPA